MTYQESLDYLYGLQKFGIKLGLENIRAFLSRLGHPESRFKTVLVAGTNGKGSTASALAGILTQSGYRTGLYTSPHLHSFCERVRIDGEPIPESSITELVAEMQAHVDSIPLTFFEFTTALALRFFAENEVDIAILEVGLGGRLDATNAIKPILSVITPIARDHEQYLGDNLAQIAREKAGIMRAGVPIVSARQEPEAETALYDVAQTVGTKVVLAGREYQFIDHVDQFDYVGIHATVNGLHPGIPGRHQFGNMATALAAAEMLKPAGFAVSVAAMRAGVERLAWPGRLEWLGNGSVLLDGAHNGAGASALAAYLAEQNINNVHWIVGVKADKNSDEILAPVLPHAKAIYCVEPPVEEAVPTEKLRLAGEQAGLTAKSFVSISAALQQARYAAGEGGVVLVAGSLFLVAAVRELILQEESRQCDTSVFS